MIMMQLYLVVKRSKIVMNKSSVTKLMEAFGARTVSKRRQPQKPDAQSGLKKQEEVFPMSENEERRGQAELAPQSRASEIQAADPCADIKEPVRRGDRKSVV